MRKEILVDATTRAQEPFETKPQRRGLSILSVMALLAIVTLSLYVVFRGVAFLDPSYTWLDRLFAVFLLGAEVFIFIHAISYFLTTIKATGKYTVTKEHVFAATAEPTTAVIIATFNEEPGILEDTVISAVNLDYTQKKVYVVDDSTNENLRRGIQDLAEGYGCVYVYRGNRRGYKAGAINDLMKTLSQKYMAVFDADQKPVRNFLNQTIPFLEEDPELAFIQTPQFYDNTENSPVAFGAAHQQAVFYEYICEGKSVSDAMFTCGSNVVYRTEALRSIGGFDEKSVTEDFATAFRLHLKHWRSLYYNHVHVYGLGPENLSSYFTQQMRWALGTLGVFKRIILEFFKRPWSLHSGQWWEYFVSGSYFLVGWSNFFFTMCPVAFLMFHIRPLIADPLFYAAAFLPYFIFSMGTFYLSMGRRGYRARALFTGQSLAFISFWVLMNAAVMALFSIKRPFGVTPKGIGGKLSIRYIMPQLTLMILSLAAVTVGIYRLGNVFDTVVIINMVWATYHAFLLGMVFYFNRSFKPYRPRPVFRVSVP
ncbi:MAG: glycosyltransferase [Dehalococcoidia bacterium]|nr:glycosyltransferase [Dehalococcoidia bacterium]